MATHKLIQGNSIVELNKLDDESVDLIIADPPYGNIVDEDWDKIDNYAGFTAAWLPKCNRILKQSGSIYVCCSIGRHATSLVDIVNVLKDEFYFQDMIVWAKKRGHGNRKGWLFTREEILWATKDKKKYVWNKDAQYSTEKYHPSWIKRLKKEDNPYKRATNVWKDIDEVSIKSVKDTGGKGKRKMLHPTQKPVALMERIILAHTAPGDTILDPFAGSGTVAVAALKHGRNCISIELSEEYCQIIKDRVEEYQNGEVGEEEEAPDAAL